MSKIAIKAENLSKAYQLGEFSTGTISRDIERWWAKVRGKEDPFLKIGEANDRSVRGTSDIVWSLKDINFEIKQGDAVGIIGRNGAGKSTLLKVLSRVTSPTTGSAKIKGRIASLLEVGTGFHPELTGRENIFLNGAILGMRKAEIKKHFDAIVDFAAVERYVDTPVKRYSSGMYVRLAFAVAAHLESEILIIDEVLAVGDAEFQKKCLGKMGEVSKGEGRTVLFVSHNMASIKELCNTGILLSNGTVRSISDTNTVINDYINLNSTSNSENGILTFKENPTIHPSLELSFIKTVTKDGKIADEFDCGETIKVVIGFKVKSPLEILRFTVKVINDYQVSVAGLGNFLKDIQPGQYEIEISELDLKHFNNQVLNLQLAIDSPGNFVILYYTNTLRFTVNAPRPTYQYRDEAHTEILAPKTGFNLTKI